PQARWLRGPEGAARAEGQDARPHAHRARRRRRPRGGARRGRRRLPHQALRVRGVPRAGPRPPAPRRHPARAPPAAPPPPPADPPTKPFAFEEFLAGVRALLRRGASQGAPALRLLDLRLDPATREVTRGRRRITLTAREYALLEYFLRNAGRVLTRPMIAQHVWGLDFDPESNIIDVYVGYLRRKIDIEGERPLLHTIRGVGYALKADA